MAKKKDQKIKLVKKEQSKNYQIKTPEKTLRSKGYFYSDKRKKADDSFSWRIIFESWRDGKKKSEIVPKSMYPDLGVKLEMTCEQVKQALQEYNKIRKKEITIDYSQIKALKRLEEMKSYNKILFPSIFVEKFLEELLSESDGKERFKKRLTRNFQIAQEVVTQLNIQPHEYKESFGKLVSCFKDRKYSVSYSKDILWILNRWGFFISRKKNTSFEPIGKMKVKTQNAIFSNQKEKMGVRKISKPMTIDLLKKLESKIDKSNVDDMEKLRWCQVAFAFGLRPSECDAIIKSKSIEYHNDIPTLVVIQTKLTVVDDSEREKRIPVVCEEQAQALEYIKQGKAQRPNAKWIVKTLEGCIGKLDVYDLYCFRKGYTDFMLSKGQSLEAVSQQLGHKNIQSSWKFYKDRRRVHFDHNEFTNSKYPSKKVS